MAKDEAEKRVAPEEEASVVVDEKQDTADMQPDEAPIEITETDEGEKAIESASVSEPVAVTSHRPVWKRFWSWTVAHKKATIPGAVVVVLLVLGAVPFTRYALAGLVLNQQYKVQVIDAETKQPVSSAVVVLAGKRAVTDGKGQASVDVSVGTATLNVSKNYYKTVTQDVLVPIGKQKQPEQVRIVATGRQVPMVVVNSITKKPVADVVLRVLDTEAKTDKQGKAVLVVPAGKQTLEVTVEGKGYNKAQQTVQLQQGVAKESSVQLVPAGKVYFLSNKSGKIDVVKASLDGSERTVVLAGTGKEDRYNTSLLASRDWRYLALHARRDSDKAKLYLIDTATDKMTVMDEGDASFSLIGWSGQAFVYSVTREKVPIWQANRQALKSYDATAKKLTTLDETKVDGNQDNAAYENFSTAYILDNEIVYLKYWNTYNRPYYYGPQVEAKDTTFNSARPDGKAKKVVKSYPLRVQNMYASVQLRSYKAQEIYILHDINDGDKSVVEEYEAGSVKTVSSVSRHDFYNNYYPTYLISPSGEKTLWSEDRDGKGAFFLGNKFGENEKQIGLLSEYSAYGWHGDDYILLTKKGSELYIAPAGDMADDAQPVKIADYYRSRTYEGYGYGYGGL